MSTEPQHTEVPRCYRHPDRETYVRCSRCDRPICPECMRDAAVGHQCPECVHEGNRSVRQARTVFGGQVGTGPVVTMTLIGINVVLWLLETSASFVDRFEMIGNAMTGPGGHIYNVPATGVPAGFSGVGVAHGEWYRLITGAFLHLPPNTSYGILHIGFNMWALWAVGPQLEQLLGRARYLTLYLLAALGGNVLAYLLAPGTPAVGASGAIFGLFGAYFVIARRLKADVRGIVTLLIVNLVITFAASSISWQGHIGGLVTGLVLAAVYVYVPDASRRLAAILGPAVVLVLLVVAIVGKTSQIT